MSRWTRIIGHTNDVCGRHKDQPAVIYYTDSTDSDSTKRPRCIGCLQEIARIRVEEAVGFSNMVDRMAIGGLL